MVGPVPWFRYVSVLGKILPRMGMNQVRFGIGGLALKY